MVKKRTLLSTRKEDAAFEQNDDWRQTYIDDMVKNSDDQLLPVEVLKQFVIVREALHYRTPEGTLARCVGRIEAHEILNRVHEESCGHTSGISLYLRLQSMGIYCPTMAVQSAAVQDKCKDCQAPPQQAEICIAEVEDWRKPYIEYIQHERLPSNRQDALKIQRKDTRFFINEGIQYRRSYGNMVLRVLI